MFLSTVFAAFTRVSTVSSLPFIPSSTVWSKSRFISEYTFLPAFSALPTLSVALLIVVFISVNVFLEFSRICFPSADSVFSSFKKSEDVFSRDWAEDVIPEKVSSVDAVISMSSDASSRLWIRLSTSRSAPFASAILETDWNTVIAVSDIVCINTWFTCFWIAVAPLSVTFGAIAFSLALE